MQIRKIRSVECLVLAALLCLGSAGSHSQNIVNGGFEDGLQGFETIGNVSVVDATFGAGPAEGNFQALLSTDAIAVPTLELEAFLGLSPNSLTGLINGDPIEGSAIKTVIEVAAGSVLEFDFNFLSDEDKPGGFNDSSFFIMLDGQMILLADTDAIFTLSNTRLGVETGYTTVSVPLGQEVSGLVQISFGVVDVLDDGIESVLLIDNINFANQAPNCDIAIASPALLKFRNGKFVDIAIDNVTDPDNDLVTITPTAITQNEAVRFLGPLLTPDGILSPLRVRAENNSIASGRVYMIDFTADDGNGGSCIGQVTVCVPRNPFSGCIGPLFDSTTDPGISVFSATKDFNDFVEEIE